MKKMDELYDEILKNDTLKKQYAEAAKNDTLVDFAKANGVDASLDEIKAFLDEKNGDCQLDFDELENVAGGLSQHYMGSGNPDYNSNC